MDCCLEYMDVFTPGRSDREVQGLMIKLQLPPQIEDRLDLLSLRSGHTLHYYVIEALLEYLDDMERRQDRYDRMAQGRIQEDRMGGVDCEEIGQIGA